MTSDRVRRGGSWYIGGATSLAARARRRHAPSLRGYNLGFRCARAKSAISRRVVRGGRWRTIALYRLNFDPGYYNGDLSLRIVRRRHD